MRIEDRDQIALGRALVTEPPHDDPVTVLQDSGPQQGLSFAVGHALNPGEELFFDGHNIFIVARGSNALKIVEDPAGRLVIRRVRGLSLAPQLDWQARPVDRRADPE